MSYNRTFYTLFVNISKYTFWEETATVTIIFI